MLPFVTFSAICCLALALAVLWANPARFTNQIFALVFVLMAAWLGCVFMIMKDYRIGYYATVWSRANTAVSSFLPWSLWLLKESIVVGNRKRTQSFLKSLPWFLAGVISAALSYSDSYFGDTTAYPPKRGSAYFDLWIINTISYATVVIQSLRQSASVAGLRRVELQLWTATFGFQGIIISAMMAIGNLAVIPILKLIAIFAAFATLPLTAWTITAYRIFDVRQVFLSIAHRVTMIAALSGCIYTVWKLCSYAISAVPGMLMAVTCCSPAALFLERTTRRWFGLDPEVILRAARSQVIALARTETSPEDLVWAFEEMLTRQSDANGVSLVFDSVHGFVSERFNISLEQSLIAGLCKLEWVTPERLQRQQIKGELETLETLLARRAVGLMITIPRGSLSPSLIVVFGKKNIEWPFTYPEVQQLQHIAEFMDNILTRSRLTAQAALKAKTEHLAMMSRGLAHDLKNLLTPISSFLVHTAGRFPPQSDEAEVHHAAQRSIRMMNEYVREARFFAEQLTLQSERVAIADIFMIVRDLAQARAETRSIRLEAKIAPETATSIMVDRVLIQRLLANLIGNAIDASAAMQTVVLSAKSVGERVTFTVSDHGCGIAPKHLSRIFEPYFTTKEFGEEVRGFGLGLTICQKIVALHGGEITVRSELGRGSTFTVILPGSLHAPNERLKPTHGGDSR